MIKRFLLTLVFTAAICKAVCAADDSTVPTRQELPLDSSKKERMAPILPQPADNAGRATIDIADASLPKPVIAEKVEEAQASAEQAVDEAEPIVTPVVEDTAIPKPQPQIVTVAEESITRQPMAKQEDAPISEIISSIKEKEQAARPAPQKSVFRWRSEPKKELTNEEELQRKIEGRSFRGETGFTTVTTYRVEGIKAKGVPPPTIVSPEGAPIMLDINDCIKIAEANHIQAIVAKKSIKLAEMRLFEARRNLLPSATIVAESSKGLVSDQGYVGRKQYIEGQQPIYHGGELYFTMKQAEVNLQIAKNDHKRVLNDLILQVKKAYYTLEKAKENSALQHTLSKEVERFFNISSKGYEAGATARVEYLNASSQVSQVKYQLASADGDVSVAGLILRQAMNVNIRDNFDIIPSPEFKKVTLDFEQVLQDALVNRPEIKANSLMVTYYNYGKGIAAAKGKIKVDVLGQFGLAYEDYVPSADSTFFADTTTSPTTYRIPRRDLKPQWYMGLKASMPIGGSTAEYSWTQELWQPVVQTVKGTEATTNSFKFKILDKLDVYSDKQLADIDYDRSRSELNKTKNDITLEVREGCFNYEKALIQLETATNKVKYQETDAELMKMKRGMDEVQDSNVVDSLIKVAQEKFGYVQAVTDCKITLAALEKAVGNEDYFKNR